MSTDNTIQPSTDSSFIIFVGDDSFAYLKPSDAWGKWVPCETPISSTAFRGEPDGLQCRLSGNLYATVSIGKNQYGDWHVTGYIASHATRPFGQTGSEDDAEEWLEVFPHGGHVWGSCLTKEQALTLYQTELVSYATRQIVAAAVRANADKEAK